MVAADTRDMRDDDDAVLDLYQSNDTHYHVPHAPTRQHMLMRPYPQPLCTLSTSMAGGTQGGKPTVQGDRLGKAACWQGRMHSKSEASTFRSKLDRSGKAVPIKCVVQCTAADSAGITAGVDCNLGISCVHSIVCGFLLNSHTLKRSLCHSLVLPHSASFAAYP